MALNHGLVPGCVDSEGNGIHFKAVINYMIFYFMEKDFPREVNLSQPKKRETIIDELPCGRSLWS